MASVTGTISSTVVTLSSKADSTAVAICNSSMMPAGMRLGRARRPHRDEFEHAGTARHRDQNHHAGQQAERVPIDAFDCLFLVEHADDDHDAGAGQRDDGAVDLFRHDDGVGDGQDAGGDPHRTEAEIDVRRRVCGHGLQLPPQTVRRPLAALRVHIPDFGRGSLSKAAGHVNAGCAATKLRRPRLERQEGNDRQHRQQYGAGP